MKDVISSWIIPFSSVKGSKCCCFCKSFLLFEANYKTHGLNTLKYLSNFTQKSPKTKPSWMQFSSKSNRILTAFIPIMTRLSRLWRLNSNRSIIVRIRVKDCVEMIQVTCIDCFMEVRPAHQWQSHAQRRPNVVRHCRDWAPWSNCTLGKKW